ncbi:hypothetical protein L484_011078 [Morus notabilis]|uniref:Uncharacterized protein n=1 Tax=Morus notabilis TaxID=981085 RepID=W9SCR9_9ROSA|nr:hypothetical protein L484_011078 [Morus notabilis]
MLKTGNSDTCQRQMQPLELRMIVKIEYRRLGNGFLLVKERNKLIHGPLILNKPLLLPVSYEPSLSSTEFKLRRSGL